MAQLTSRGSPRKKMPAGVGGKGRGRGSTMMMVRQKQNRTLMLRYLLPLMSALPIFNCGALAQALFPYWFLFCFFKLIEAIHSFSRRLLIHHPSNSGVPQVALTGHALRHSSFQPRLTSPINTAMFDSDFRTNHISRPP